MEKPEDIRVHVSVVLRREGRWLLVREGKEGSRDRWNLPGGHLEPGETFTEGIRREAKEVVVWQGPTRVTWCGSAVHWITMAHRKHCAVNASGDGSEISQQGDEKWCNWQDG